MIRCAGRGALVALLALLLAACTLDLHVDVEVHGDGSGAVDVTATVDAGALQSIGGDLGSVIDVRHLRAEGWTVQGPTPTSGGGSTVRLRQGFRNPDEAAEVLAELAGPDASSPFRGLEVTKDASPFRTTWRFGGSVDLDRGSKLPGTDADLGSLEDQLGESLDRLLQLRIGVRLPGSVRSNATTKAENGAVWQVRFGDGALELDATGTQRHVLPYVGLGLLGVAALVGLVALLVRLAGRTTGARPGGRAGP